MTTKADAIHEWLAAQKEAANLVGCSSKSKWFQKVAKRERDAERRCREFGVTQADISAFESGEIT